MDDLGLSGLKSAAIGIMDGAGADHSALLFSSVSNTQFQRALFLKFALSQVVPGIPASILISRRYSLVFQHDQKSANFQNI